MRVKCEHCGVEYANRRNLKRHFNDVHSENVKYVACCMHNCDRIFFRREYLLVHLETTHKLPREDAKDLSHSMLLNSTLSINLDGTITFRPALVVVCSLLSACVGEE
jgi:hypothetical protein